MGRRASRRARRRTPLLQVRRGPRRSRNRPEGSRADLHAGGERGGDAEERHGEEGSVHAVHLELAPGDREGAVHDELEEHRPDVVAQAGAGAGEPEGAAAGRAALDSSCGVEVAAREEQGNPREVVGSSTTSRGMRSSRARRCSWVKGTVRVMSARL